MGHRKIEASVKAEAVRLVVEANHSTPQAAQIMGVGPTALRRWVEAWREREAQMPATVAEQRLLIEQLQAHCQHIEAEISQRGTAGALA